MSQVSWSILIYCIDMWLLVMRYEVYDKLPFMLHVLKRKQAYPIMPRSPPPHLLSKSSPYWLITHLCSTVILVTLTCLRIILVSKHGSQAFQIITLLQEAFHFIFVSWILINKNLVNLSNITSLFVRLGVCGLLTFLLIKQEVFLYFVILTLPTWITFYMTILKSGKSSSGSMQSQSIPESKSQLDRGK